MATVVVRAAHSSGQFTDTPARQKTDAARLTQRMLDRKWQWLTGTEAGARSVLGDAFEGSDAKHGLRFRKPSQGDVWVVYRTDLFEPGTVKQEFYKVIEGQGGPTPFGDRGVFRVTGRCPLVGANLSILVAHYLTEGHPGQPGFRSRANQQIANKIGALGREFGKGRALVFYGGDQNTADRRFDTFRGNPFTSLADELNRHLDTGHGSIDVMASYNGDVRVVGKAFNTFDDSEFPLATDHYLCEGSWTIKV